MNTSVLELLFALVVGLGLGLVFFGGLAWTVRRLPSARHPVALVLGSLIVRTAAVAVGLVWVGDGKFLRMLAAATGILAMRYVAVRLWGPTKLPDEMKPSEREQASESNDK